MAQYNSTHTGTQIDNAVTLISDSTDTSGTNVPSSSNKLVTVAKLNEVSQTYTTCTLPVFSAAGSKNVAVTGVTANSHPTLDVYIAFSSDVATLNEAWSHIYRADSYDGGITFYSDAATSTALTVMIKGY